MGKYPERLWDFCLVGVCLIDWLGLLGPSLGLAHWARFPLRVKSREKLLKANLLRASCPPPLRGRLRFAAAFKIVPDNFVSNPFAACGCSSFSSRPFQQPIKNPALGGVFY